MEELVQKIKEIGLRGGCGRQELHFFLPNLPMLRGSEFIFTIGHANASDYLDKDVEWFVKGLHRIEQKYKEYSNHDFGFGSPSPTSKVILALEESDPRKARALRQWVISEGGNYYDHASFD
jgi:hypothetical protein